MASKKSKNLKPAKSYDREARRRTRILQIVVIVFSILLILSMVLQLTTNF